MMRFLSYSLKTIVPGYGNPRKKLSLDQTRAMKRGDACDIYAFSMENHWGTHVDCPAHFCPGGKAVVDFTAPAWYFSRPQVFSVKLEEGELLTPGHLKSSVHNDSDLLLFKSGWSQCRGRVQYSRRNPGVHASMAHYLRSRFPRVRAVGFDWVSLSSFLHREDGWTAHRAFLTSKAPGKAIRIFEDMDLSSNLKNLQQVWAVPFRMEGLDSAPCTIIGVFK